MNATLASGRFTSIPPRCYRADPRAPDAADRPWWLGHVKPCQELGLAADLGAADVPFLLPLVRHERRTPSGKRRITDRPLFPGYAFITGDEFDRTNAAATGRLVGTIPIFDVPALLADLASLMDVMESGLDLAGASSAPRPGDRVRVVSGLLENQTGTLVRETHGGHSLLLHVHIINRVVEFEVESWRCELIEDDAR